MKERTLGPNLTWQDCDAPIADAALGDLRRLAPTALADARITRARVVSLPFYRNHSLLDLTLTGVPVAERAFVLHGGYDTYWLDGAARQIHAVNELETIALDESTVLDYVRFFLFAMRGEHGAFTLVESADEIELAPTQGEAAPRTDADLAMLRGMWSPLRLVPTVADEHFRVRCVVAYRDGLFDATFALQRSGEIEMVEDEPLAPLAGFAVPACPTLLPAPEETEPQRPTLQVAMTRPAASEAIPSDRQVTEAAVSVLLAEAVRASLGHRLLQRFNTRSQPDGPIRQLTRFVDEFAPIVLIESEIPFVEDIVAGLLGTGQPLYETGEIQHASAVSSDDSRCYVDLRERGISVHLISFHAYRSLWDAERTAHDLSVASRPVLIGCERQADVPEALRRVADLCLTLPRLDEKLFTKVLKAVMGAPPPARWNSGGGDWVRYLLHSDFHALRRLALSPDEAVEHLRERARARLAQVTPSHSPRLDELHGLGDAREVAEDLIADISAARRGRIPWSAVDRGLLLVGAPGTGKTTLARAIAQACRIRFVHASAAAWQSAGGLDMHLRAIRASFGEARRYAPSILFLDEIDSIGNRERFTGSNAIYQTEVVNGLLEQMQGMDENEPVIVIGATNFLENVDPALRRAGRLDQVVTLPRPSIQGLEKIFQFHLTAHRRARQVAGDVRVRRLAQLAFGLTGADVEFFVRGAARRARKERRRITQSDLVAEITRRPRRPDSVIQLNQEDMRRVATHEAGHAIAALLGNGTTEREVTYVSIIPRMDGSLGFTASIPADSAMLTRGEVMARLATMLGGRAAEEVVYGAGQISLGSGGGETSDLAVATRFATQLVCSMGLGSGGSLQWVATPGEMHLAQVDTLLTEAYRAAMSLMQQQRAALDRVVDALVEHQELDGATVRRIALGGR
jgi:AAA+ superfamily predicted ATPase